MEKRMKKGRLREFYIISHTQMQTRGEGVKKSKNFEDIISGSSLTARALSLAYSPFASHG